MASQVSKYPTFGIFPCLPDPSSLPLQNEPILMPVHLPLLYLPLSFRHFPYDNTTLTSCSTVTMDPSHPHLAHLFPCASSELAG
jgi:hypothetical protein